ncbi:acetylornithine aminotransferase [Terrihabitans soli]|uniref:Acetylornithine aminotransferase n=1 Tax=Terrihabitans soli TaxID=708113 RepID=A0A6S6QVJ9_9HYPH|nr:acetylornithine aminotransferase [Terrihabitans soli]
MWLITDTGERYLDFGAGIAVNALGHAHPHLVAALQGQAAKLWHISNLYQNPDGERLAQRLVENSFAEMVFFANSGAEANEAALKMARKYQSAAGHPEKWRTITFAGAFHGRTLATISAGGSAKHLDGFGPKVDGFDQIADFDEKAVLAAVTPETAAIIIEPVQGEGGIRPVPASFLKFLRRTCDENDLLLIYDEVQTGIGRTGHLFGYELSGVAPDIMSLAKGLGGGFPVGACLATAKAASGMTAGSHGTTFGGNPLAMAVGNAVLDVILEKGFLDAVKKKGLLLKQKLAAVVDRHPAAVTEIRGEGLMLGLKCLVPNNEVVAALAEGHVLSVPAGDNVVRLLPPLIVSEAEIDEGVEKIDAALGALEKKLAQGLSAAE